MTPLYGTAGDGLGASSEARRVVKALLNLARVLRSADAHRDVPSEADSTGPALARHISVHLGLNGLEAGDDALQFFFGNHGALAFGKIT